MDLEPNATEESWNPASRASSTGFPGITSITTHCIKFKEFGAECKGKKINSHRYSREKFWWQIKGKELRLSLRELLLKCSLNLTANNVNIKSDCTLELWTLAYTDHILITSPCLCTQKILIPYTCMKNFFLTKQDILVNINDTPFAVFLPTKIHGIVTSTLVLVFLFFPKSILYSWCEHFSQD